MRTMRNLVGLLFLGALLVSHSTGLRAYDAGTLYCDEGAEATQGGVVCYYSVHCYFDATPLDFWEDPPSYEWPYEEEFCQSPPTYEPPSGIGGVLDSFCNALGYQAKGDIDGHSSGPAYAPWAGYWIYNAYQDPAICFDGEFMCYYSAVEECPE
jgi:hypothetical protein